MRILHTSDLHIGKRLHEFSLLEDQKFILNQIVDIATEKKIDVVMLAGDIYDKASPSAENFVVFENFLEKLSSAGKKTVIISGNHDSAERLSFGSKLMAGSGIYINKAYDGTQYKQTFTDEFGSVNFYMLPFIRPATVRHYFKDEDIKSYTDAVAVAIKNLNIDKKERNIILSHQFVTGSTTCDSEDISVGGVDNVDKEVYSSFDYVALGHIHGSQNVVKDKTIRYSGSPLKYSVSEFNHQKTVTIIDIKEKGNISIKEHKLQPMRDLVKIKGEYNNIMAKQHRDSINVEDYMHVTLTDESEEPEVMQKLRSAFCNVLAVRYENKRTATNRKINENIKDIEKKPLEIVKEFYELQNNNKLSAKQLEIVTELVEDIWGEN